MAVYGQQGLGALNTFSISFGIQRDRIETIDYVSECMSVYISANLTIACVYAKHRLNIPTREESQGLGFAFLSVTRY